MCKITILVALLASTTVAAAFSKRDMKGAAYLFAAAGECGFTVSPKAKAAAALVFRAHESSREMTAAMAEVVSEHEKIGTTLFCAVIRKNFSSMLMD
jgi:hypothetical protein